MAGFSPDEIRREMGLPVNPQNEEMVAYVPPVPQISNAELAGNYIARFLWFAIKFFALSALLLVAWNIGITHFGVLGINYWEACSLMGILYFLKKIR